MYENIQTHINSLVSLDDNEMKFFLSKLKLLKLNKGELLLNAGDISKYVAFINSGIMRYYFIKEGEEITGQFFFDKSWVSDYFSFLTQSPSQMYIEAITDTELLLLSYQNMQILYKELPKIEKFGRVVAENIYIGTHLRNNSLIRDTPEERYLNLINQRPKVIENIPQYLIASYLGVKPESLSRIRKRIWAKKKT